ncbi:RES family NAD+ phosphorylase [Phragmitibacter flavus]|uniref:RES family NAD+ phosphorylase n=1 Tax=Phragmitibacter flavus TaxID=2576071 RepID=UPI00197F266E|nr:RES family NAD+ phosphorylase [Phragmitibacter flavus]
MQRHRAEGAFDGEGARLFGGRWNLAGQRMVYTSSSLALAAMEVLVHLESTEALQRLYAYAKASFPHEICETLEMEALPTDWHADPPPIWTATAGDAWLRSRRSAVLKVPSSLIPDEANYLLNPLHADFAKIEIQPVRTFAFPPRLLKGLTA